VGYFNVIAPCYVPSGPAKGHYVNLPSQTIEVPDETAAPLVESGCLEAYPAGRFVEKIEAGAFTKALAESSAPLTYTNYSEAREKDAAAEVEAVKQALQDGEVTGASFTETPTEPVADTAPRQSRSRSRRKPAED
jgi:hypothetical protein